MSSQPAPPTPRCPWVAVRGRPRRNVAPSPTRKVSSAKFPVRRKFSGNPPRQRNFPAGTARHINGLRADSRSGLNREFLQRQSGIISAEPGIPWGPSSIRPSRPPSAAREPDHHPTSSATAGPLASNSIRRDFGNFTAAVSDPNQGTRQRAVRVVAWLAIAKKIALAPFGLLLGYAPWRCGGRPSKSREIDVLEN